MLPAYLGIKGHTLLRLVSLYFGMLYPPGVWMLPGVRLVEGADRGQLHSKALGSLSSCTSQRHLVLLPFICQVCLWDKWGEVQDGGVFSLILCWNVSLLLERCLYTLLNRSLSLLTREQWEFVTCVLELLQVLHCDPKNSCSWCFSRCFPKLCVLAVKFDKLLPLLNWLAAYRTRHPLTHSRMCCCDSAVSAVGKHATPALSEHIYNKPDISYICSWGNSWVSYWFL